MKLDFKFNKRLGSFTLDVKEEFDGGITGVFGPSGSGKTTFLHCLSGFIKPDEGHIRFNDQDFFSSAARVHCPVEKRHIGMVFQDALLFPHMTMKQNICYGLRGERKNKKQVNEMLDILNLFHLTDRYPQNLSGGERQRVALARALIRKPSLLLMDEPISSVDLKARSQILIYLKKVHQVIKVPLIYVSHSVSEMLFLADRVMVLDKGKNIAYGEPLGTLLNSSLEHVPDSADIDNIYDLPVREFKVSENLVVLDFFGTSLNIAYYAHQIRPSIRIGIKARDIIVANAVVSGISARNIIKAELIKIAHFGKKVVLHTSVHDKDCLVEITAGALDELKLKAGDIIYLIIKARSIVVLE